VHHFAIPPENTHSRDIGTETRRAGFIQIEVKSIRQHVIKPFHRYWRDYQPTGITGRIRMFQRNRVAAKMDYVLVTARKPN
jgi:hypothetical protein